MWVRAGALGFAAVLAGCTVDVQPGCDDDGACGRGERCVEGFCIPADATAPDAAAPDAAPLPVDGAAPSDARVADARPDAAAADGAVPDATTPDGAVPDGAAPDAAVPDAAPACPQAAPEPPPSPPELACRGGEWRLARAPVTATTGHAESAALVGGAAGFALAWAEVRDGGGATVRFARRGLDGTPAGGEVVVAGGGADDAREPALAWSGTEYGLVWTERLAGRPAAIRFARLAHDGTRCGEIVTVSRGNAAAEAPVVTWDGDRWGLFWSDRRHGLAQLYHATVAADGTPGPERRLFERPDAMLRPSAARGGGGYGLAWTEEDPRDGVTEVLFVRLRDDGTAAADFEWLTDRGVPLGDEPSVAWNGELFGVAWRGFDRSIRFSLIFPTGGNGGFHVDESPAAVRHPSLLAAGGVFAVVWADGRAQQDIYIARVTSDGGLDPSERLTDDVARSVQPAVAASGPVIGVAWSDDGAPVDDVHLAAGRLRCP